MPDRATILYVEDDPNSRLLIQRTLTFAGYRVLVASCGLDGIDLAKRELPDLILIDMDLPDLSGREVTTRLRSDVHFRDIPIVALTAQTQVSEREKAFAAGLTGYLNKPIDVEKLPTQITHYLRGGRDVTDEAMLRRAQTDYNQEIVSRLESKIRELERTNAELRRL